MARYEIPIGAGAPFSLTEGGEIFWLEWRFPAGSRPRVPPDLMASGEAAFLSAIQLGRTTAGRLSRFELRASQTGTDRAGDLVAAWETHAKAIAFEAGGLSVVAPGPAAPGHNRNDDTEPYSWNPTDAQLALQRAFADAYLALPQADRDATVLALDDGSAPLATIRIPAAMALIHRAPQAPLAAGARWRRTVRSLLPERGVLGAAEIEHPLAPEPVRIVSAGRPHRLGGRTWLGVPFKWRLAADEPDRGPRTQLVIPWAGQEMADLLEASDGAVDATVALSEWSFDPRDPEAALEPEWRLRFNVVDSNVVAIEDAPLVAGQQPQALVLDLGVTPRADRPAVSARATPASDPWAFA